MSASTDATTGGTSDGERRCRSCGAPLERLFVDLGMSPPCEAFLTADQLLDPEAFYPLDVRICDRCLLVQLPAYVAPDDVFREYAYFSSYSDSWVEHGPDQVYAKASERELTAFVRVMIIPASYRGRSTITYVRPEDQDKPKSQSYKRYLEEPIAL